MRTTTKILAALCIASFATATSFGQVKIGTNPTVIGSTSNLEVEAANNKKFTVNKTDGTVQIENTPSGTTTDNILTVDASGNVRAIPPQSTAPTNVYVLAKQNSAVVLPHDGTFGTRVTIPLGNELTDTHNAWNSSTSTFTAPEDGFYLINFNYMVDYDGTAIYSSNPGPGTGGFLQIGVLKSAGAYAGTPSGNNGRYFSSFQGEDSGGNPVANPGTFFLAPNYGGGVFNMTLFFKAGEQLIPQVAQANGKGKAIPNGGFSADNFISISKL